MPDYLNLINGQGGAAKSGAEFGNRNPASGAVLHTFPNSGAEEIAAAVEARPCGATGLGAHARPAPRRDPLPRGRDHAATQGRAGVRARR